MISPFFRCLRYERNRRAGSAEGRARTTAASGDRSSRTADVGHVGMMPRRNSACCPHATPWRRRIAAATAIGVAIATLIGSPAAAADPAAPGADLPDVGGAAVAAVTAARWLEAFDAPDPESDAARVAVPGTTAVRVALRARGRVVGEAVHAVPLFGPESRDAAAVARSRDLLVRRAAGSAMAASLGDRVIASLRDVVGESLGSRLTLEIELAGPLVPLAGLRLADVAMQLEPGLDGVALRWEDRVAMRFPAAMIADATASDLARVLPSLASELGLPLAGYEELRDRFGVRLHRFRTLHFVQRKPGASPSPRMRGQELVALPAIGVPTLVGGGRDLFNHIVGHLWAAEEPLGLRGDYDAAVNGYRPAVAPAREQALVAFASARWAAAAGLREDDRTRAIAVAEVVLEELRLVAAGERDPLEDPVTAAAIVLAESRLRAVGRGVRAEPPVDAAANDTDGDAIEPAAGAPGGPVAAAPSRGRLLGAAATDVSVLVATLAATAGDQRVATSLDPHDRAVLLAAATRHALDPGGIAANGPEELAAAVAAVRASVPAGELVSLMPWLAMAEADLARLTGRPLPAETIELLRAIRAVLERVQIPAAAAPDLAGGFALTDAPVPLAGAQSVRPAALLGWMLRRPDLTSDESRAGHEQRLRLAMRFIRQLAVRDPDLWAVRGPSQSIGGLRAATWDLRMPLAAQAMGLLAYAEALDALTDVREPPAGP